MGKKGNIILIVVLIIGALVALGAGAFSLLSGKSHPTNQTPVEQTPTSSINVQEKEEVVPTVIPINENILDMVLLGMGGAGHDGGTLSDSITLARFDTSNKTLTLVAIPRDLWVPIPSGGNNRIWQKINMAYAQGGGSLTQYVLGQTLAIKVDHYLAIDFANFISAVEDIDGVDVEVPKSWDDYYYPIKGEELNGCGFTAEKMAELHKLYSGFELEKQFTCRWEHLHFEKGVTHLDGTTALKYVRSRHSAEYGSDFARGERAQAVLLAIGKKLITNGSLDTTNSLFKKLAGIIKSDVALGAAAGILAKLGNLNDYTTKHVYLTDQNVLTSAKSSSGAFILIPKAGSGNFADLRKLVTP